MGTKYDRVYYWTGGRERGTWNVVVPGPDDAVDSFVRDIERMGYVTVRGWSRIGPPEGPPDASRFAALGL